ncbi:MAG TPA: hypothetical protein VF040_16710 [Ktedonobacterales bacterium]
MALSFSGNAHARFCHLCGTRLRGRYLVYNSTLVVCADCDASCQRCARCNVPIAQSALEGKFPLCATCARDAPRCDGCSLPITSTWYTFEELLPVATPRRFCPRCVQGRPRCDLCRAPVADGAQPLSGGQYRCALCLSDVVRASANVREVYDAAVAQLGSVLGGQLRVVPHLQIVTRRRMGEIRRSYEHHLSDATSAANHHVLGYFVQANGVSTIYIEQFLPRGLLLGTLAHELAHAWQTEQSLHLKDPILREGFAEWVAYRVLIAGGLSTLAERATRRDDVYGRGLRHFLNIENRFGYTGVVRCASGQPT